MALEVMPSSLAVIELSPIFFPVIVPSLLIATICSFLDFHVTKLVMSVVFLLEYLPEAVRVIELPMAMGELIVPIVMLCSAGDSVCSLTTAEAASIVATVPALLRKDKSF